MTELRAYFAPLAVLLLYKATDIKWLPFMFSFLSILNVWCVTSHVASLLMRFWLSLHNFYNKGSYEFKCARWFTFQISRFFFKICIAAVVLVDNDENTKFFLYRKSFYLKEMRCIQSYRWHLLSQETKTRINSYVKKPRKRKK